MGNTNEACTSSRSIKEGYLIQNLGTTKRRCFVRLTNDVLFIENDENNVKTERINLRQITKIISNDNQQQFELYPIHTKFICKSLTSAKEWISQLESVLTYTNKDESISDEKQNTEKKENKENKENNYKENEENKGNEENKENKENEENSSDNYIDNNDTDRGELIFQTSYYTKQQMEHINDIFEEEKSAIFLFGDNNVDKNRADGVERQHFGGQASIIGMYDKTFAFGITTTFMGIETPSLLVFGNIINKQFEQLKEYLLNGRDIIIPSPTKNDLLQNKDIYFSSNKQIIFHNIGTGIAQLPSEHIQYIQLQISELQKHAHNKINNIVQVDYYGYQPLVNNMQNNIQNNEQNNVQNNTENNEQNNSEYERKMLEMENKRLKMKILEMKRSIKSENDDEAKSNSASTYSSYSVSDDEKYETLNPIKWKWKGDKGKWISHTDEIAQKLERCSCRSSVSFILDHSGENNVYVFHKTSKCYGFQVNKKTDKGYEVKRSKDNDNFSVWEWRSTKDNIVCDWVAYSDDICSEINKLQLFESYTGKINDFTYLITKLSPNQAVQRNLTTKTERDVRKKPLKSIEEGNNNTNDAEDDPDEIKSDTFEKLTQFEELKKRIGYTMEWQWKEDDEWKTHEALTTTMEKLKIGKHDTGDYFSDSRLFGVSRDSFNSGTLTLLSSSDTSTEWVLRRIENISKELRSRFEYPAYWTLQHPGSSNDDYQKATLIPVSTHGKNLLNGYVHGKNLYNGNIVSLFKKSLPKFDIITIEAIQNQQLFEKYSLEKSTLSKTIKLNEKWLFHKTGHTAIQLIMNEGFRNEFSSRALYGAGTYFGITPGVAHPYANKAENGKHKILACKVITGESSIGSGSYSLKSWPRKENGQIYDSLIDNKDNPTIFVIHENRRAYPHFVITYRENTVANKKNEDYYQNLKYRYRHGYGYGYGDGRGGGGGGGGYVSRYGYKNNNKGRDARTYTSSHRNYYNRYNPYDNRYDARGSVKIDNKSDENDSDACSDDD